MGDTTIKGKTRKVLWGQRIGGKQNEVGRWPKARKPSGSPQLSKGLLKDSSTLAFSLVFSSGTYTFDPFESKGASYGPRELGYFRRRKLVPFYRDLKGRLEFWFLPIQQVIIWCPQSSGSILLEKRHSSILLNRKFLIQ